MNKSIHIKRNKCVFIYRLAPKRIKNRILIFLIKLDLPPASGLTITAFLKSGICKDIHRITAGSANRLSTGISKKPYAEKSFCFWQVTFEYTCICEACKSIVMI
jgi:hypothetical protein